MTDQPELLPSKRIRAADLRGVDGVETSLTAFARHPATISLRGCSTHLTYDVRLDIDRTWVISDQRFDPTTESDFALHYERPLSSGGGASAEHRLSIVDGYVSAWLAKVPDPDAATEATSNELTPRDSHDVFCEHVAFYPVLVSFFDEFDGYDLETSAVERRT